MATAVETIERITRGAVRALARHGPRKLTMTDICDEAGVSRGTLYRYFKDKDQVLEAIGEQVERTLRATVGRAVADDPDRARRLRVVLRAVLDYQRLYPETVEMARAEPRFALDLVNRRMPAFTGIIADALEPAFDDAEAVRSGLVTRQQLAEMLFRFVISAFVVPSGDGSALADRVADLWASLMPASPAGRHTALSRRAS
jgi:AcrR family transcriptional regulator